MDPTRRNTKFGLLAFSGCAGVDLEGPLALGDGVSVHPGCPIELSEHWITWLGSIQAEHLTGANLVFTVQIESEAPTILDAETDQLAKQLQALRFGLLLHGIPEYRANLLAIGGIDCEGDTSVRRIEIPGLVYRHPCGYRPAITTESLASTSVCANQMLALYGSPTSRRVRAGLRACTRGMEELRQEERLHQYVRAIDGLTQLRPGQGARMFSQRAQLFAAGGNIADILIEMYQLRNAQEHLNDFRNGFRQVVDALTEAEFKHRGSLRACQAERAALVVYQRLLTTPGLLARLESENSITEFWTLDCNLRRNLWGAACDMDAVQAQHDATYTPWAGQL